MFKWIVQYWLFSTWICVWFGLDSLTGMAWHGSWSLYIDRYRKAGNEFRMGHVLANYLVLTDSTVSCWLIWVLDFWHVVDRHVVLYGTRQWASCRVSSLYWNCPGSDAWPKIVGGEGTWVIGSRQKQRDLTWNYELRPVRFYFVLLIRRIILSQSIIDMEISNDLFLNDGKCSSYPFTNYLRAFIDQRALRDISFSLQQLT